MTIDSAFTDFPSLTTERLHLRRIQPGDADGLYALKSDPDVTSRYGQEPHASPADTLAWIERTKGYYDRREALMWGLELKGREGLIGACPFWNFGPGFHSAEIGYELHPDHWGQGLMSEALTAIFTFGFDELGLHRIEACPYAGNIPSINLLRKLGFTYEGTLRQRHLFRGEYQDMLYFGLLADEWHPTSS